MNGDTDLKPKLVPTNQTSWQNAHVTYNQPIRQLYDLWNPAQGENFDRYNATTQTLMDLIGQAQSQNCGLRALGGGWSLSPAPATDGILVNTKLMNIPVFPIGAELVDPAYSDPEREKTLRFVQCGNSILELHRQLREQGRGLKSCGASNGQSLAGALSTGTHGAGIDAGSIANYVVGLHIVVGPSRHVWLERASYPVVTKDFADALGAEWIRDDNLFNAALISIGGFGLIHGLMIETDPLFLYEMYRKRMPYDTAMKDVMNTLDFSKITLPKPGRPYHFQILINAYDVDQKGVSVNTLYRSTIDPKDEAKNTANGGGFDPAVTDLSGRTQGDDALAVLGKVTQTIPGLTPATINVFMNTEFPDLNKPVLGTLGEIFSNTTTRGRTASTSMAVPVDYATRALDLLLALNKSNGPFAGIFSQRFVKGNPATLGWIHYPSTCVIELDGAYSNDSMAFFDLVAKSFIDQSIPHRFHWGKMSKLTPADMTTLYGDDVKQWLAARKQLLDLPTRKVFTNAFMEGMGLSADA
ncbi:MAG TPA: FAD-binding protein [Candidatus Angelobacter sp.]|nr:FAD-binding protein [Candidatus Angelobacter sp.]